MNSIHIQSEPFSNIFLSRCFYKLPCFVSEPLRAMPFWQWETYSNDYAVKMYLCPGLVNISDLWMCQTFWILCSFTSRAKGASSNKLHIKPFIVLILYFMTFIHYDSSCLSVMLAPTKVIKGSVLKKMLSLPFLDQEKKRLLCHYGICLPEARKVRWPYAGESPWRMMLFNMPSQHHRGLGKQPHSSLWLSLCVHLMNEV